MASTPVEVTVGELLTVLDQAADYHCVAGPQGLMRHVGQRTIQRVGVALTGYTEHLVPDRIQMLGRSESGYLASIGASERRAVLDALVSANFPALVITAGHDPAPELYELANTQGFALITTPEESVPATERINGYLSLRLAPHESLHGVLVDIYGVGVLLTGKSGIGKSELGLELVASGHRLVADDLVRLAQTSPRVVMGTSPELTRHHMEIRGLGILNIKDLFGAAAVRERKRVELVAELVEWNSEADYDRLGLESRHMELAGVPVRHVVLPVRPGRSLKLILEVAARNQLLQAQGTHSARAFADRLGRLLDATMRTDGYSEEETAIE
ncbi:MAG: HPr(Ser) kinase/phosphatase [Myxococcales bacterium]|nr:HPr(Ser) kinase/phosphatase [Myxococcales bacterium]